jgi:hypothetical protein
LKVVDLVLLHPQFALEELLVEVGLAANHQHGRDGHAAE